MGIWFRDNLKFEIIKISRDADGRLLSISADFHDNYKIKFVNIYAPVVPRERNLFFTNILQFLTGNLPIIMGGDFNCVTNNNLDKRGGNNVYGEYGGDKLQQICSDLNIVDAFRHLNPLEKEYTWRNAMNTIEVRLDRFYISKHLIQDTINIKHGNVPLQITDHKTVNIKINFALTNNKQPGPGFWKCNINTLKDEDFKDDFGALWDVLNKVEDQNGEWWEGCKAKFKDLITAHSKRLNMIKRERLKVARKKLDKLLHNNPSNQNINIVQSEIDLIYAEEMEGCKIRSKEQYLENKEKPTRYFLRKEKQLAIQKTIKRLIKVDGNYAETNPDIIQECVNFYTNLYNKQDVNENLNPYFFEGLPRLSEQSATVCEGPITLLECQDALKQMSNSKTPGLDGLPKEFYIFAFKYIGKSFVKLINRCDGEGILPPSQRQGLITLICKDVNNAETLKNWRPISLLNVDYKILSKVLTLRLRKVIGEIVHPDQTCSIPGRTIQDNIHLIRNLIEYLNSKNISAAIVSLDQSKAFDRVSHDYLINTLNAFGFKPHFISLIKLLYTQIYSKVLVNGHMSKSFTIGRSVRQGCSLSPLLYVLCMEPFAHRIRTDPMVKGIPLPGTTEVATVCQYADDTNLFITKVNSIHHILKIVDKYEQVSGALLNREKTFGMWVGRWRGRMDQPADLHWSSDHHKFYGIYLGSEQSEKITWDKVVSKLEKCTKLYSGRDLSYRGRSVIMQVVFCSTIWYTGSLLLMPASIRRRIEKTLFSFLWKHQHEALKRNTLYNSFQEGGLNITDVKTKLDAFLVKQVITIIKGHDAKWDIPCDILAGSPHSTICAGLRQSIHSTRREDTSVLPIRSAVISQV